MSITNLDKPSVNTPQTEFNIGSGFNLLVGGVYRLIVGAIGVAGMTNLYKDFNLRWEEWTTQWSDNNTLTWAQLIGDRAMTNLAKIPSYETWATILSTWGTETRTWLDMTSIFDNVTLNTDPVWSYRTFPWQLTAPWQQV